MIECEHRNRSPCPVRAQVVDVVTVWKVLGGRLRSDDRYGFTETTCTCSCEEDSQQRLSVYMQHSVCRHSTEL